MKQSNYFPFSFLAQFMYGCIQYELVLFLQGVSDKGHL